MKRLARRNGRRTLAGTVFIALVFLPVIGSAVVDDWVLYGPEDCDYDDRHCAGRTKWTITHPDDPTTIYAGHSSGGLWRSTNDGSSWQPLLDGNIGAIVYRRPASGQGADRLVVGTGTWSGPGNGFWVSETNGDTWTHSHPLPEKDLIWVTSMALDVDTDVIYAGTNQGLRTSDDGGLTWSDPHPNFWSYHLSDVVTHPTISGIALAGVRTNGGGLSGGLYRTTNGGQAWTDETPTSAGWPDRLDWGVTLFAWSQSDPGILYMLVVSAQSGQNDLAVIARSTTKNVADLGKEGTWSIIWDREGCENWVDALCSARGFDNRSAFAVALDDPDYLLIGAKHLYRSTDGGRKGTWENLPRACGGGSGPSPGYHMDIHHFHPVPGGFWLSTDGGMFYHEQDPDKGCWELSMESRNTGLYTMQFYSIAVDPFEPGDAVTYGGTQDQGTWIRDGRDPGDERWYKKHSGDGWGVASGNRCPTCITEETQYVLYAYNSSTLGTRLYASCDILGTTDLNIPGSSWGPILNDPQHLAQIYTLRNRTLYQVAATGDCTVSEVGEIDEGGQFTAGAIAGEPGQSRRIYGGTANGYIYRFVESGSRWILSDITWHGGSWDYTTISDMAIIPGPTYQDDILYVTLGNRGSATDYDLPNGNVWKWEWAYHVDDRWTPIGLDLPKAPLLSILIDPDHSSTLYTSGMHGTFWTHDGGTNWTPIQFNLPDVQVTDLVMHPGTRALYAGTYGRSIWRAYPDNWYWPQGRELPPMTQSERRELEVGFRTVDGSVGFATSRAGEADVSLYDVQGRFLRRLFSGRVEAGEHVLEPDFTGLKAGVYFARMRFNEYQVDAMKFMVK